MTKITPAMRKRLREIKDPRHCRWVKYSRLSITCQVIGSFSNSAPNYVMIARLEDAGLIEWQERTDNRVGLQACLTATGLAESN